MSDRSTPSGEAARALRDIDRRRSQARGSMRESRWVFVVFGVALFVELAAPDFFGKGARPGVTWAVFGLLAVYEVLRRTRRGSAVLGMPTRVHKSELSSSGFAFFVRLVMVVVLMIATVATLYLGYQLSPYAGAVLGAVLGGAVIAFGPTWQKGMSSLAMRGRRGDAGVFDGSR